MYHKVNLKDPRKSTIVVNHYNSLLPQLISVKRKAVVVFQSAAWQSSLYQSCFIQCCSSTSAAPIPSATAAVTLFEAAHLRLAVDLWKLRLLLRSCVLPRHLGC